MKTKSPFDDSVSIEDFIIKTAPRSTKNNPSYWMEIAGSVLGTDRYGNKKTVLAESASELMLEKITESDPDHVNSDSA